MSEMLGTPTTSGNLNEDEQRFASFLEEHPELDDLRTGNHEQAPFYLGHQLAADIVERPDSWATPTQTLTTGGWKYDGDKED